jgi:hypothetical protein
MKERMIIDENSKKEDIQDILGLNKPSGIQQQYHHGPPPPPAPPMRQEPAADLDEREGYQWDQLPLNTALTDQQAQLCPAVIKCVSISTNNDFNVSVGNLEPVSWNREAIELLVLDENKKDLLKGLVAQHSHRTKTGEFGDLIENKGKGLVILLHGPPGVSNNQ